MAFVFINDWICHNVTNVMQLSALECCRMFIRICLCVCEQRILLIRTNNRFSVIYFPLHLQLIVRLHRITLSTFVILHAFLSTPTFIQQMIFLSFLLILLSSSSFFFLTISFFPFFPNFFLPFTAPPQRNSQPHSKVILTYAGKACADSHKINKRYP